MYFIPIGKSLTPYNVQKMDVFTLFYHSKPVGCRHATRNTSIRRLWFSGRIGDH